MTTDRIAATIRRILEGAAKAGDPADYVRECIAILKADKSWGSEEIAEIQRATLLGLRSPEKR